LRFFDFVEEANLAAAVDSRLIDASNRIVGELAGLDGTTQDTREREEITQDGRWTSTFA